MRTLYEMREEMRALSGGTGDTEGDHSRGDDILIEALRFFVEMAPEKARPLWKDEAEDLISSWRGMKKWFA